MNEMNYFFVNYYFLNSFLAIKEFQCILMLHISVSCFLSSQINFVCMTKIMLLRQKFILSPFVLNLYHIF